MIAHATEHLPLFAPRSALDRHSRTSADAPIYCGTRSADVSVDALRRYEELGVHSVQIPIETLEHMQRIAYEVLPAFR